MMSPEAEARYNQIVAENKARFDDPEFQRAARLFFARADWRSRQDTPEKRQARRRENWWLVGYVIVVILGAVLLVPPLVEWLEKVTRANHPGMHWVPQVNGHWEKDTRY